MPDNELNLDWVISTHSEFLQKFGITKDKIITGYDSWKANNPDNSIRNYFCELLRQACVYIAKNADTEEEFFNSKLELDTKMLEYAVNLTEEAKNYLVGEIHFDKLMISHLTLPFKFEVQIDSDNCCSYCAKKNKKIFSFEKVLEKKFLPFAKCKREDGCNCTYSIIPLHDENGRLIEKYV
jgi:hypothetical protein